MDLKRLNDEIDTLLIVYGFVFLGVIGRIE